MSPDPKILDDIARVAKQYLSLDKGIIIYEIPTLTTTQFYILMITVVVFILSFALYFYLKARSRIRKQK